MKNSPLPKSDSPPAYVTREELDALTRVVGIALARVELAHARSGFADGNVATQLERAEAVVGQGAERAALKGVISAFDRTMDQHYAAERQRAAERGNAYQRI